MTPNRQYTLEVVKEFLSIKEAYDYYDFVRVNDYQKALRDLKDVDLLVKENLSEEEYKDFHSRNFPFTSEDPVIREKEEILKQKVVSLANRIAHGEANLIDILKELNITPRHYIFYVRNLERKHCGIGAAVASKNRDYYWTICAYDAVPDTFTTKYLHITEKDEKAIRKIVKECEVPLNVVTYVAAYRYAVRKGLIKLNNKTR